MINKGQKLNKNIFDQTRLELIAIRDGFGRGLVEAGKQNKNVISVEMTNAFSIGVY
jgi:hypothetical protein